MYLSGPEDTAPDVPPWCEAALISRRVITARRQKLVEQCRHFGDNGLFGEAQAHLFSPVVICVLGNRSRGGRGSERTGDSFHDAVPHSATA